ncbi:MAG: phosphotransferase [Halofilum sp. (in: g-proteobacteria)]|nr:phosphotransferase [Halofilum sp. (in: g-proteobacteria)]
MGGNAAAPSQSRVAPTARPAGRRSPRAPGGGAPGSRASVRNRTRNLHEQAKALLDHHLHDRTVALGLRHGDFSLGNIHVQGERVTGLIDWDDSDPDGIAMEDAISHLSSRIVRRVDGFAETFLGLATREALHAEESAFLDRCYAYYGMDSRMHPGLVLLFWAHAIDAQLDFAFAREASYRTSRIHRVLELFTGDARLR